MLEYSHQATETSPLELSQHAPEGTNQIQSYTPGTLKVGGCEYTHSIIVSSDKIIEWSPRTSKELSREDIEALVAMAPPLLIIGTGATAEPLPVELLAPLLQAGIPHESMSTSAACRTLVLFAGERREVLAALLID